MTVYRTVADQWEPVYEPWDGPELTADDYDTVQAVEWAEEDYPR